MQPYKLHYCYIKSLNQSELAIFVALFFISKDKFYRFYYYTVRIHVRPSTLITKMNLTVSFFLYLFFFIYLFIYLFIYFFKPKSHVLLFIR